MSIFRKIGLATALAVGLGCGANAAVVEFNYQGNTVSRGGDPSGPQLPGMFGTITIDTDQYLNGSLANSSFIITAGDFFRPRHPTYAYTVTGDGVTESDESLGSLTEVPFILGVTGTITTFFNPGGIGPNSAFLRFDEDSEIVEWRGIDFDGGSSDNIWDSVSGDSFGGASTCRVGRDALCTRIPGTWSVNVVSGTFPAPAVIPLPASGLLLMFGLGFLFFRRFS